MGEAFAGDQRDNGGQICNLMHTVKESVNTPLAVGQSELTRFGCKELMDANAIDICNVDSSICGGITEWMKIPGLANLYHISMAHHEE